MYRVSVEFYRLLRQSTRGRRGHVIDQSYRAAESVILNIAEAYPMSGADRARRFRIAGGEAAECRAGLDLLEIRAPVEGRWVAPEVHRIRGAFLHRGERLGAVVQLGPPIIRADAPQQIAAQLLSEAHTARAEIQIIGRASEGKPFPGQIEAILPAGQERLASAALGNPAGGSNLTAPGDPNGTKSAERVFEVRLLPQPSPGTRLLGGQRVQVRVELSPRPLVAQWWHSIQQVFQKRFHVA